MTREAKRLGRFYDNVEPTEALNEKVLCRVEELRVRDAARRPALSRRTLLVGAAGCTVIAGLTVSSVVLSSMSTSGNVFGLAIANADELGGAVEVSSGPEGLMPCENDTRARFNLKLNLAARGSNIKTVTYSIDNGSLSAGDQGDHRAAMELPTVTLASGGAPAANDTSDGVAADSATHLSVLEREAITIEYRGRSGSSDYHPDEGAYNYISVDCVDEMWDADSTLQLMRAWLDLAVQPSDEVAAKREAARHAFVSSYDELAADDATFYEWLRDIYVTGFELDATRLAEAALVADVTFEDGSTASRSYRIDLVEDHEQVLLDRFDALCELNGYAGIERAQTDYIPWVSLPIPTDEQVNADSRLSRPIFTIEDVTGR